MKKLGIILIILLIGSIIAYFIYKQMSKHNDPTESKDKVSINAIELYKNYTQNEASADSLYLGKVIDLTGNISEIEKNDNRYTLYLNTTDSTGTISCEMDTLENSNISKLNKGNSIKINGFCNGINIDVQLDRCKIVN